MTRPGVSTPPARTVVRHLGLTTPDLRAAEDYYRGQLGMEVMFRETLLGGQWHTLPEGFGWDDAHDSGVDIGMVALGRQGLVLALFREGASSESFAVIGLVASQPHLSELRARVGTGGASDGAESSGVVEFVDLLGITWQISDDDRFLSNGETSHRWLRV